VQVLHPSCELGAKATDTTEVLVARVYRVNEYGTNSRGPIRTGFIERGGQIQVAAANTFWLPPEPDSADGEDQFTDFRWCQRVPLRELRTAGRLAALDHDARVALIRRELYFRYRHIVSTADVQGLEAARIANDPAYESPRPSWADG
jgi:hypothetical protein